MAIVSKDTAKKQVIDLTGPEGNAFFLLGTASNLCKQLDIDEESVLEEMKSGGYENLINTFDKHFGSIIDLER